MQNEKIAQDILDFNKNAVKSSFEVLNSFSDQTATAADQLIGAVPNVPEEGKKAVGTFFKENQKGLTNLQKSVEAGLEIDLNAKDAPVKGIEVMESFYNGAFSQATAIQKEAVELFAKTSDKLPKEVKPVVDFWNQTLNSNVQLFQGLVTKNFEFTKKIMADIAGEVPKAAKAAAK